jgi:hypothetical protein
MKKLLLASVLAIASTTASAAEWTKEQTDEQPAEDWGKPTKGKPWDVVCAERHLQDAEAAETDEQRTAYDRCIKEQPARVTVAPPYSGPPPIGWVYGQTFVRRCHRAPVRSFGQPRPQSRSVQSLTGSQRRLHRPLLLP